MSNIKKLLRRTDVLKISIFSAQKNCHSSAFAPTKADVIEF